MPYYRPAYLYTGFEATLGVGASFTNFRLTDYTSGGTPSWESATAGASPSSPYYDTWNSTASLLPADPFNPSVTRVELAPNTTTEATANVLPTLVFTLAPGGSVTLTNWLVEPYALGEYFDGNTREGGLIPGSSGYGTGSSDYRWAGTANNSYSYYTLDYKRVYEVADDIVKNYLAPITIKDNITIVWDYYFGKT
jgi:hypothetical protein